MLWLVALVLALLSVDLVTCLAVQAVVLTLNHLCASPDRGSSRLTTST